MLVLSISSQQPTLDTLLACFTSSPCLLGSVGFELMVFQFVGPREVVLEVHRQNDKIQFESTYLSNHFNEGEAAEV